MENKSFTINFRACALEELGADERALVEAAREATFTSYAPYSSFHVGAALRLSNGETVRGSNQENAAFSAGTCAERCALFFAHAQFPDARVETIAVAARGTDGEFLDAPISPCGVCRQALIEAETRAGKPVRVLLYGRREVLAVESVSDLLPFRFDEIV